MDDFEDGFDEFDERGPEFGPEFGLGPGAEFGPEFGPESGFGPGSGCGPRPEPLLYLDCQSGIAGDMLVAALLDLGASEEVLRAALKSLPLSGYSIEVSRVKKAGIDCCDFNVALDAEHDGHDHDMAWLLGEEEGPDGGAAPVEAGEEPAPACCCGGHHHGDGHGPGGPVPDGAGPEPGAGGHHHGHAHRGLPEVEAIIEAGALTPGARELARRAFRILAEAEARAHALPVEQVHFHEVGAVDSIVDIVAAAVLLDDLGIRRVVVPVLVDGYGSVRCQHGVIPVPAPATLNICIAHGLPLAQGQVEGELVTPTGAALVAALRPLQELPARYRVQACGLGAGKRAYARPSVLRAMVIEELEPPAPKPGFGPGPWGPQGGGRPPRGPQGPRPGDGPRPPHGGLGPERPRSPHGEPRREPGCPPFGESWNEPICPPRDPHGPRGPRPPHGGPGPECPRPPHEGPRPPHGLRREEAPWGPEDYHSPRPRDPYAPACPPPAPGSWHEPPHEGPYPPPEPGPAGALAPEPPEPGPSLEPPAPGPHPDQRECCIIKLECDIDDSTGEELGYAAERLRGAGAREVHWLPIFTKKGRPAWQLQVLCLPEDAERLEGIVFAETSTIGIRRQRMERTVLPRGSELVETPYGPVRCKAVTLPDGSERMAPEYEDCAAIAREQGVPLRRVMEAALWAAGQ